MTSHAIAQTFETLGYKTGDRVYIRCLAGKGYDVKADKMYPVKGYLVVGSWEFVCIGKGNDGVDREKWRSKNGLDTLQRYNDKGYGVYFVPNAGGDKDDQITRFSALFYECDDIEKDEQWERISRLGLEPSLVIDTRNSLHVYYVLSDSCENWREYQQRLIQLMDSDPSIYNESRLMRLPGFDHHKKGLTPYSVTIVSKSDTSYQLLDFGVLPEWDAEKWSKYTEGDKQSIQDRLAKLAEVKEIVGDEYFPLEICLSKKDRQLINSGVSKGLGYTEGFKLACNLIGTENYLRSAGFRFNGNAEQLFYEFASRSSESYRSSRDIDLVLNNAKRHNPTPTLSPDAIEKCINSWRYKNRGDSAQYRALTRSKIAKKMFLDIEAGVKGTLDMLSSLVQKAVYRIGKGLIQDKNSILKDIPEKENYRGEIVKFAPGTGDKVYEKAARMGYKYVLDQSPTGAGKTHTVSKLTPGHFFVNPDDQEEAEFRQIIYCSQSHRNPNNEVIESDFYEMVSRTTGYELDYDKLTPLGRPYRVKADDKTLPELRTKSNCHWSGLFNQAYAAGHSTEGFCGGCQYFDKCRTTNGEGYGYLSEANQFKKQSKVHAHLKGLPVGSVDENVVLIIDEAETAEWVQNQSVSESDVRAVFKAIKEQEPEIYKLLLPLKDALTELFDEDNNPAPDFGWTSKDIPLECPKSVLDYIPQIQTIEDSLRPAAKDLAEGKSMPQAFLVNLIHVLTGKKRGTWSGSNKHFNIHSVNGRNLDHIQNAHCTVFQDATMSRKMLALIAGCEESEILLVRQEMPQKHNLTINQYVSTGRLTNQRSQDEVSRSELWREHLSDRDIGWVEYKAFAHDGDLIHGGDGRGSNAYKNKQEIGIMGIYRPNMTAVLTELEAILGQSLGLDSEEFQEYYGHKVAANVLQEIGRLRNNRRDEDNLIVHIVGDGELSFLEDLGLDLRVVDATDINPELANIEHRTKARNLNMGTAIYRELGLDGLLNMDQKTFAERLGITAAAFCQWGKRLFGRAGDKAGEWYKRFKDAILALVAPKPTDISDPERVATVESLVNDVFPILVRTTCTSGEFAKEFGELIGVFGWEDILEALNRLAMNLSARLLFRILRFAG